MTFWDYLVSPGGDQFMHAIIVLVLALAGWLSWLTRQEVKRSGADAERARRATSELLARDASARKRDSSPPEF